MKISIITFHSSHNYGAVLQAYALQQYLLSNGYQCEIIDFRSKSQRDFNSLYPHRNGVKSIVKNILMFPYDKERRKRDRLFEKFISEDLILTDCTIFEEADMKAFSNNFDVYISGSDQIWNTTKKADVSNAYFLDFVSDDKTKIAYAVSLGNASSEDIKDYKELISRYDCISARENAASLEIEKVIEKEVETVLDPTLLVDSTVFENLIHNNYNSSVDDLENYIFYYSLDGFDVRDRNVEELRILSNRLQKKVVVLTPEWPKKVSEFINVIDAGPKEFLALIKNADLVCTNSFHGTALAICFKKNFYVLDKYDGHDARKVGILEQLGLMSRMIQGRDQVNVLDIVDIDYNKVYQKLDELKSESCKFLDSAISKKKVNICR